MRVVIFGSRGFQNYGVLKVCCYDVFARLRPYDLFNEGVIVSGTARGADILGEKFAKEINIPVERYPANWNRQPDGSYDKLAGFARNESMADISQVAIGFWSGFSPGTRHMVNYCKDNGLMTFVFDYEGKRVATYNVEEKYL